MTLSRWLSAGLAVGMLLAVGCKTDELVNPKEPVRGPNTSLENPSGVQLPDVQVSGRNEIDLVEQVLLHRAMYARTLRLLAQWYTENGYAEKAQWAQSELADLTKHVKPYRYIMDSEVPVSGLQPTTSIADADQLYAEGVALMKKGGHGIPALYNQETMKQALAKFKELVDKYPNSDKIAAAAFQIAEIHKEYFEEKDNAIAVQWYQRALDWDPNIQLPVRFQMAVILDYRMHERERALAMYQEVLAKERFNKSNLDFTNARIRQLTDEKTRHSPTPPVAELRSEPAGGGEGVEAAPVPPQAP